MVVIGTLPFQMKAGTPVLQEGREPLRKTAWYCVSVLRVHVMVGKKG